MLLLHNAQRWIDYSKRIDGERENLFEITMHCTFNEEKTEIIVVEKQKIQLQDDEDNDNYEDYPYTEEELKSMYRDAFEGDPEAEWNID